MSLCGFEDEKKEEAKDEPEVHPQLLTKIPPPAEIDNKQENTLMVSDNKIAQED